MIHILNKQIRSFFALDLNQHASQQLATFMIGLKSLFNSGIDWLPCAKLHITLCFLGNVPIQLLPRLVTLAKQQLIGQAAFSLTLDTLQYFPNSAKPKVLALLPQSQARLHLLAQLTEQSARDCGLNIATRPYHPHLSLARIKADRCLLPPLAAITPVNDIMLDRVTLFQSAGVLGYIPLARFTLSAPPC